MTKTYQVMPDLSEEEFADLKSDIAERGVMVPIELDEDGNVLDGHHRLRACEELGITDYPTIVREGMTEDEKLLHALTLNTARRHLTRKQKAEAVIKLLERDPSLSDRKIAQAVGVSHPTVGKYRRQVEGGDQVVSFTTLEEPKEGRGEFTCCICGKEGPAYYERARNELTRKNRGEIVNVWGYDPWPLREDGDCCYECWLAISEVAHRMPRDDRMRHYLGPHWRELLEVSQSMYDEGWTLPLCDSEENTIAYHEYEREFHRRLEAMGIDGALM